MDTLKTLAAKSLIVLVSLIVAVAFIACCFLVFINPIIAACLLVALYFVTVKTFELVANKFDTYL